MPGSQEELLNKTSTSLPTLSAGTPVFRMSQRALLELRTSLFNSQPGGLTPLCREMPGADAAVLQCQLQVSVLRGVKMGM